jgi:Tol biopolymer transport system component
MRYRRRRNRVNPTLAGAVLVGTLVVLLDAAAGGQGSGSAGTAQQRFSGWSAPVNLGAPPNSAARDAGPFISRDGLRLYFGAMGRTDSLGGFDLYVSRRASVSAPWGEPQNLGPTLNTSANDQSPALSADESQLYFYSDKPGGRGGFDLYVSRRKNTRDESSWQPPENLGSQVNSDAADQGPYLLEDEATRVVTLFFSSNRPGGPGLDDIYASALLPNGTFGPPRVVLELSTPSRDLRPAIRRDGLELFLDSDRPGGIGSLDIWVSMRRTKTEAWSTPVNLGPVINTAASDVRPALSFDGTALYFHSGGRGGEGDFDLFVSTRALVTGRDPARQ